MQLPVLHVDDWLVVADKPDGQLAVTGRGEAGRDNLLALLERQLGPLHVVHRLDQATSGLIVFARTLPALRHLHRAFAAREVNKAYVAVVHGHMAEPSGMIDLPLSADWPNRPRQKVDPEHGKPSLTRWTLNEHLDGPRSRLTLEPLTGRSHQLRVHLRAIGHGIVGDRLYGDDADAHPPRLLLHAQTLTLAHPGTGQRQSWHSPARF